MRTVGLGILIASAVLISAEPSAYADPPAPATIDGPGSTTPRALAPAAAPPTATGTTALVMTPPRPAEARPAAAAPAHSRSPWWVWAVIAAGIAGLAAIVVTSAGKDPACPADRSCR
jgi:hypothetical protein